MRFSKVARLLVLVIVSLTISNAFYTGDQLRNLNSLARVNPLKTAGHQSYSLIPRLEPGLRLINKFNYDSTAQVPFETLTLEALRDLPITQQIAIPQLKKPLIPKIPLSMLFQRVRELATSFSARFMLLVKKFLAFTSVFASIINPFQAGGALSKAVLAATTVGGVLTASPSSAQAGLLKYKDLSPIQRVATTPLYYICNSRGSAYLQEDVQAGNPDQRTVVYFMSYEDADNYLNEMTQQNNIHASEFRVMTVSMEKVLNMIQAKKQSRKMGRYEMDLIYRIQPSSKQCITALKLSDGKASSLSEYAIPMFAAEGIAVKRKNGEVVTPYYFSYEDLVKDWEQLRQSSPDNKQLSATPKVIVKDFTQVMMLADGHAAINLNDKDDQSTPTKAGELSVAQIKEALLTPGIVPSREEIDRLRSFYREKGTVKGEFSKAKLFAQP